MHFFTELIELYLHLFEHFAGRGNNKEIIENKYNYVLWQI